jgi:hypothetical protein
MNDPVQNEPDDEFDGGVIAKDYTSSKAPGITWWHKLIGLLLVLILIGSVLVPAIDYFFGPQDWPWESVSF